VLAIAPSVFRFVVQHAGPGLSRADLQRVLCRLLYRLWRRWDQLPVSLPAALAGLAASAAQQLLATLSEEQLVRPQQQQQQQGVTPAPPAAGRYHTANRHARLVLEHPMTWAAQLSMMDEVRPEADLYRGTSGADTQNQWSSMDDLMPPQRPATPDDHALARWLYSYVSQGSWCDMEVRLMGEKYLEFCLQHGLEPLIRTASGTTAAARSIQLPAWQTIRCGSTIMRVSGACS
jgi:hypothetical protein